MVHAAGAGGGFAAQMRTYPKLAADDIVANMSTLELSDEQVISLVRGLPAERKRAARLALAQEAQAGRGVGMVSGTCERIEFGPLINRVTY
jgi:hypothetical protein